MQTNTAPWRPSHSISTIAEKLTQSARNIDELQQTSSHTSQSHPHTWLNVTSTNSRDLDDLHLLYTNKPTPQKKSRTPVSLNPSPTATRNSHTYSASYTCQTHNADTHLNPENEILRVAPSPRSSTCQNLQITWAASGFPFLHFLFSKIRHTTRMLPTCNPASSPIERQQTQ